MINEEKELPFRELENINCPQCGMPYATIEKIIKNSIGVQGGPKAQVCINPNCQMKINIKNIPSWKLIK